MTRIRQCLIVSIALSYAAAKAAADGNAYETHDTSFTFDVADAGLAPVLSEGLGSDAAAPEGTCFDGRCRDSPTYYSMMGLPCEGHGYFDCSMFIDMGFTQQQVDELIDSCPCSCNVACPEESVASTVPPTSAPSASPVSDPPTKGPTASPVSDPPTFRPSASPVSDPPTASPSDAPVSDSPTKGPSASPVSDPPTPGPSSSPVSDSPTRRPSMSPVSSNPTPLPSAAPVSQRPTTTPLRAPVSPSPTVLPTHAPTTLIPSALPSFVPSSGAPTSSPEQMSTTTRMQPIQLAAETTCPSGYSELTPTTDCRGAIHCSNGVKIFGPIPCLTGPTGSLVFDIDRKMCVLKTDDFVCRQPPSVPDTDAPRRLPTSSPTASPDSSNPTARPSEAPVSANPTARPSRAPASANPTAPPSKAPVSASPTARPSRAPVSPNPTARPSRAPVAPNQTIMPPSPTISRTEPALDLTNKALDTGAPTPRPTGTPTEAEHLDNDKVLTVTYDEEAFDIIKSPNENAQEETGEGDDETPAYVATERSFWNTSISSSNEASKMFTPLVIGIIAGVGVLVVVFAAAMFSLGQRHRRKRSKERNMSEVNIKPGDKIQIDNLDDVIAGPDKKEEDEGFASNLMDMIFGPVDANDNATMGPDGAGSTIKTGASLISTGSKMNSIIKSITSKESTQKVMESIETARQQSFEATKKHVEKVKKVAEDPGKAVQEATQATALDVNNCGDRVFHCASQMLCLPNDVRPLDARSRGNSRPYKNSRKNLQQAFFDPDDDMSSVYEDV